MEDVHTAIQQSDCLVNSSTSEGMCAAILEVGTLTCLCTLTLCEFIKNVYFSRYTLIKPDFYNFLILQLSKVLNHLHISLLFTSVTSS